MALFIIAAICVFLPAITFLIISIYIFFQFGRQATIEIDLDTFQLGLIQLAIILFFVNTISLV